MIKVYSAVITLLNVLLIVSFKGHVIQLPKNAPTPQAKPRQIRPQIARRHRPESRKNPTRPHLLSLSLNPLNKRWSPRTSPAQARPRRTTLHLLPKTIAMLPRAAAAMKVNSVSQMIRRRRDSNPLKRDPH